MAMHTAMIDGIRAVESALGNGHKVPTPSEIKNRVAVRRSITTARDLPKGACLTATDVVIRRPETGVAPGQRVARRAGLRQF